MADGFPVIIMESGGIPYVQTEDGPLAIVATNGLGVGVTEVTTWGIPLNVIGGVVPPEDPPSLNFSQATNSMYFPLLFEDF